MHARIGAALAAAALLVGPAVVAADEPPPPPTIVGVCASAKEYFWKVETDAPGLARYPMIDYTTKKTDDWAYPNGATEVDLAPLPGGRHATTLTTNRADGPSLYVRWTDFPGQVATSSAAPSTACALATLTVQRIVQEGTASPDAFPVSATWSSTSFVDPALSVTITTPITYDTAVSVQPGGYLVGPAMQDGTYLPLPAGYLWRSTVCRTTRLDGSTVGISPVTTHPRYQQAWAWLDPDSSVVCAVTYHYGPVLGDSIAAGKRTTGTTGFTSRTITVKKGTYVTYLVTTSPSLAGRKVQIWTKTGSSSKPWKLTKTVAVASDGSIRYSAKVTSFTGFQARWAGDGSSVASAAEGRYVKVRR